MIDLDKVSKYYGDFPAIQDISFRVEKGEVLGFLGPNGAGKSTTMKIITGFLPPTSGRATVADYDVVTQSVDARRHIGYLPETVPLYAEMSVRDYLGYMGRLRGMSADHVRKRTDDVVAICRLEDYRDSYIGKLSKGFRQRVGIAQAILHEPDVLVMDEPTIGIDPVQVVETRQLIRDLGGEHTLIISTHILPEVSMICERVIIIHEGQIVAVDKPENLSARLSGTEHVEVDARGPRRHVTQALQAVEGVREVEQTDSLGEGLFSYSIVANPEDRVPARLAEAVVGGGWELVRLQSIGMTLEEIFLRLTTVEEEGETPA